METSCASTVTAEFDRSLALLHNFWYARALAVCGKTQKLCHSPVRADGFGGLSIVDGALACLIAVNYAATSLGMRIRL